MHVRDVIATIEYEELDDVVLVGHSYGCMVITGAYEAVRARIRRLVYLDGPVPRPGQSIGETQGAKARELLFKATIDLIPPPPMDDPQMAWYASLRTPQPINTLRAPLDFDEAVLASVGRTFIYCSRHDDWRPFADRVRSEPGWSVREIDSDHFPMVRCPEKLAELLMAEG